MSKISLDEFNKIIEEELQWAADSGLVLTAVEKGKAVMVLPYDRKSLRPGGTIAGPHMMTLADACMYAVVLSLVGKVKLAVTTNFNINFLRKPAEGDLIGEGSIIKLGKRLAVMEVSIFSEDGKDLVAHATGTYSIPPVSPDGG